MCWNKKAPAPSKSDAGAGPAGCSTATCSAAKTCDATVTIGRVMRGNPYVPKNAPASDGMPDSVPPGKTYEVEVTVTWSQASCPGQYIELSIINGSADNGTATVAPTQITATSKVTVTGGDQTKPGNGGNLKIQAKLDGATVKVESAGFTVCAHPLDWSDTLAGGSAAAADIDDPRIVGVVVQDGWDSDSGTFGDLSETEISEVVDGGPSISPPFPAMRGGGSNSTYLTGGGLTQDTHTIGRPAAGPGASHQFRQLSIFKCHRCGAVDKVQPNSGLTITHYVFDAGGGHWKHHVKKVGAKVTVGAYTSEAGTANVTSLDHDLP